MTDEPMTEGSRIVRACYPGSFDPMTIAHVAIAEAVRVDAMTMQTLYGAPDKH